MIEKFISKEFIQLNVEVNDWKDAIKISAKPLLDKNIIKEKYIDNMIASVEEMGPYIALDRNIALAHARPDDSVNEIGLSFMTIKNELNLGSDFDPIKLMLCLSAVDSDSHIELIMELSNVLCDKDIVNKIISENNVDDVIEILNNSINK
ncbi:PTS sugar transporter subunit IIA [uncultured Anaerococcus sp.]|uniref:PTS sugar transporter subunit IIA n=1 Tax=uncultured Anaerococcus sp. TaxID=293428 RepID=UPI00288BAD71|nr:PTS sugar transporter subunit IIA [uncultured Anaerococcus sp.]